MKFAILNNVIMAVMAVSLVRREDKLADKATPETNTTSTASTHSPTTTATTTIETSSDARTDAPTEIESMIETSNDAPTDIETSNGDETPIPVTRLPSGMREREFPLFKDPCTRTPIISWFTADDCHNPKLRCAKYSAPDVIGDILGIWAWTQGIPVMFGGGGKNDPLLCLKTKGEHARAKNDCASGDGERVRNADGSKAWGKGYTCN